MPLIKIYTQKSTTIWSASAEGRTSVSVWTTHLSSVLYTLIIAPTRRTYKLDVLDPNCGLATSGC